MNFPSHPLLKVKNILITPASHGIKDFKYSTESLIGPFWESVKEHNTILYDVGYGMYYCFDSKENEKQNYDSKVSNDIWKILGKDYWPTSAGQIEAVLVLGFNVVIYNCDKWFDYPAYWEKHYSHLTGESN